MLTSRAIWMRMMVHDGLLRKTISACWSNETEGVLCEEKGGNVNNCTLHASYVWMLNSA